MKCTSSGALRNIWRYKGLGKRQAPWSVVQSALSVPRAGCLLGNSKGLQRWKIRAEAVRHSQLLPAAAVFSVLVLVERHLK